MQRKRLLLADDHATTRSGLAALFRGEGFAVQEAADGLEAWQAILACAPDLVITDLDMPGLDGAALIERIRSQHPRLPIVVISGGDPLDAGRRAVGLRADRYVCKPCQLDEVLDAIEDSLRLADAG